MPTEHLEHERTAYASNPRAWCEEPRHARALSEFRQLHGIPGTRLLQQVAEHATLLMRADAAVVALRGADGLEWEGAFSCVSPTGVRRADGTLADRAMREGVPQLYDDATGMPEEFVDVEALGWRSAAAMPLVMNGVVVGALLVGRVTGVLWGRREHIALTKWMSLEAIRNTRRAGSDAAGSPREDAERNRLANLFRRMPIAVCVLDDAGTIAMVNAEFCALAERAEEDLVGRPATALLGPHAEGDPTVSYYEEMISGRRRGYTAVRTMRLPNGEMRRIRVLAATLRYENEGRSAHVFVVEDVTAAEAQEQEMRAREQRLLMAQRRDAMSQLAGGLAHEFNNALAAISGLASLLRDDLPAADPRRSDAEDIIHVSQEASELTRRLLDLNAGRLSERATMDLRDVLRGFVAVSRRVLPSTIELAFDLPSASIPATVDRTQLEQALLGLVLNARDAMPDGGRLEITLEVVSAAEGSPRARIGFADSGPGIPPDLVERLWTPFFSTKPAGTGLGLSFALAVLREHGGDLRLESPPRSSAVFAAYLPVVADVGAAAAHQAQKSARATPAGRTVLLVEDERLVRATTMRVLSRAGYRVVAATDGEEALRVFEENPDRIDVLVTDLQMPRLAGVDLVTHVRRIRPQLPVLVTSAHPAADSDDQALRAHSTARLRKPFPMSALLETLDQLLAN